MLHCTRSEFACITKVTLENNLLVCLQICQIYSGWRNSLHNQKPIGILRIRETATPNTFRNLRFRARLLVSCFLHLPSAGPTFAFPLYQVVSRLGATWYNSYIGQNLKIVFQVRLLGCYLV